MTEKATTDRADICGERMDWSEAGLGWVTCELPRGHEEPHSLLDEKPGQPCRFCGDVLAEGGPCSKCWTPATPEHLDSLYLEAWLGHDHD